MGEAVGVVAGVADIRGDPAQPDKVILRASKAGPAIFTLGIHLSGEMSSINLAARDRVLLDSAVALTCEPAEP